MLHTEDIWLDVFNMIKYNYFADQIIISGTYYVDGMHCSLPTDLRDYPNHNMLTSGETIVLSIDAIILPVPYALPLGLY